MAEVAELEFQRSKSVERPVLGAAASSPPPWESNDGPPHIDRKFALLLP